MPDADSASLRFAGGVGTGFDQRTLETLAARMRALRTDDCPFDPAPADELPARRDVGRPRAPAHVEIAEFTNERFRPPCELHRADLNRWTRSTGGETAGCPIAAWRSNSTPTTRWRRWRDEFVIPDPDLIYLDGNSLGGRRGER